MDLVNGFRLSHEWVGELGGLISKIKNAIHRVPPMEFHVFLHHRNDNYAIYDYVTACRKHSAYLKKYWLLKIVTT